MDVRPNSFDLLLLVTLIVVLAAHFLILARRAKKATIRLCLTMKLVGR
jgi:hypothetical protein